jgi:hypothetical protein
MAPGNINTRRPYFSQFPQVTSISIREPNLHQWYDALQAGFQRRLAAGFAFNTHYTWSTIEGESRLPWDSSQNERRHRWVLAASYEVPGYQVPGIGGALLRDWQVSATTYWQSGVPIGVTNAAARSNTGGNDRPNMVCDPELPSSERTLDRWFKTECFVAQPQFTAGDAPAANLDGPSTKRLDLSVSRMFPLGGTRRLQLRWEIYNLTNTSAFSTPNSQLGTVSFGKVESLAINSIARQMQFGVRFLF